MPANQWTEAKQKFDRIDTDLKLLAARFLEVGDALLYRTEHVAPEGSMPSELVEEIAEHDDMLVIEAGAFAEAASIEQMIAEWHRARRSLGTLR